MSRKEIQTIILLSLGAAIIWALTACEKKYKGDPYELSVCENEIKMSIKNRDFIWYDGDRGNALKGAIISDIKVTNYQVRNISLEEIEKFFEESINIFVPGQTDRILPYIRKEYSPENVSVDVSFTVQYYGKPSKRFDWTCYFTANRITLFYCQLKGKYENGQTY